MTNLALHGGTPIRSVAFPPRPQYGPRERNAANEVVASGNLSGFQAWPSEDFYGGYHVRALEEAWCEKFEIGHAVAMNSATSCLYGALAATGVGSRANVLVTPWSMSASAIAPLQVGATPVFRDIEVDTYGLESISLIEGDRLGVGGAIVVHLFGSPAAHTMAFRDYCEANDVPLVEDCAQAPGALWQAPAMRPRSVGTIGTVGVFSLNRHKQIQAGEGGIAITRSGAVAERLREYRNHGETCGTLMRCGNYRMGEVEAAIGKVQLERLESLIVPREENAAYLTERLLELPGLTVPSDLRGLRHVYYLYPVRISPSLGSAREWANALVEEGVPVDLYVPPLYRIPALRGYARVDDSNDWKSWYPNVEACSEEVLVLEHVHAGMTKQDLDDVVEAFRKVWEEYQEKP